MKVLAMLVGAALFGAVVWFSVVADALTLWHGAGLYALVVVAFPTFIGLAVWFTDHPADWWLRYDARREVRREAWRTANRHKPL